MAARSSTSSPTRAARRSFIASARSAAAGRHIATGYGYCTEPNWSPDGKRVAFNVREGGGFAVAVLDLGGGTARVVASADAERPAWGADSRHLLYSDGSSVVILDVPTGKKTRVAGNVGKVSEPTWSR